MLTHSLSVNRIFSLISACNQRGLTNKATEIFNHIQSSRSRPDVYTYGAALLTAAKERNSTKALDILQTCKENRIALNRIHYGNAITAW